MFAILEDNIPIERCTLCEILVQVGPPPLTLGDRQCTNNLVLICRHETARAVVPGTQKINRKS